MGVVPPHIYLALVVVLLAYIYAWYTAQEVFSLHTVEWQDSDSTLPRLVTTRRPALLTGYHPTLNRVMHAATEYIEGQRSSSSSSSSSNSSSSNDILLKGVKSITRGRRVVHWEDNSPFPIPRPYDITDATWQEVLEAGYSTTGQYLYFNQPISNVPSLQEITHPLTETLRIESKHYTSVDQLGGIIEHDGTGGQVREPHHDTHAWIGSARVVAQTHYDTSHNIYIQLYGVKEFTLWPPHDIPVAGLHSCLHAHYRQTRLRFASSDESIAIAMNKSTNASHADAVGEDHGKIVANASVIAQARHMHAPIIVTLRPGDMLYLPPYWLHRVEAVTPSVSVNVWSDSQEYLLSEAIFTSAFPFEDKEKWPQELTRMAAVRYFFPLIMTEIATSGVVHKSGEPVSGMGRLSPWASGHYREIADMVRKQRYELEESVSHRDSCPEWQHRSACRLRLRTTVTVNVNRGVFDDSKFTRRARYFGALFAQMRNPPVRDLYLANLFEHMLNWALDGQAHCIYKFLKHCV